MDRETSVITVSKKLFLNRSEDSRYDRIVTIYFVQADNDLDVDELYLHRLDCHWN